MNCISSTVGAKNASYSVRSILFGNEGVSWSNELSPPFHSILSNKLKSCGHIRCHEVYESIEERLSSMLLIESCCILLGELAHLKFADYETVLLDAINDLSRVLIRVRLNHSESSLSLRFKFLASEEIPVLYELQLTSENCDNRADEEIFEIYSRASHPL